MENKIQRRITGPRRDGKWENGEWRRLQNEEIHNLYLSPNVVRVIRSRRLRCAGHVARMEEGRSAFRSLTGKTTGRRPLGSHRRRQEENIRMNLKQIHINTRGWVDLAHDRDYWRALLNATLNPWCQCFIILLQRIYLNNKQQKTFTAPFGPLIPLILTSFLSLERLLIFSFKHRRSIIVESPYCMFPLISWSPDHPNVVKPSIFFGGHFSYILSTCPAHLRHLVLISSTTFITLQSENFSLCFMPQIP